MHLTTHDVIIAGGGPVGLFLALELGIRDVSVLVLEKEVDFNTAWKVGIRGLHGTSIEALYRRGMMEAVREGAFIWRDFGDAQKPQSGKTPRGGGHFAGIPIDPTLIDFSKPPFNASGPAAGMAMMTLENIETVLQGRVQLLGIKVLRGQSVDSFEEDSDGITVHTNSDSFRASWLVGCDGGRSTVRKKAGFVFEGTDPTTTGYTGFVEFEDATKLTPGFSLTPKGISMIGPFPKWISVAEMDGGKFDRSQEVTREHLQEVVRRVTQTDVTIKTLKYPGTYTDQARQATEYRKGRVLLAGDAAHIHSPFGGQGLNTGLMDAINLGWKLASTIKGTAPTGLLDTYEKERHAAGEWTLMWTRAQMTLIRPDPFGHAIAGVMRELMKTRDGATYIATQLSGMARGYDLPGDHRLVGKSSPDFEFSDGSRLGSLMRDGKAIFLDIRGEDRCRETAQSYDGRLKYVSQKSNDDSGLSMLFIRPDGIVAWAVDEGTAVDEASLRNALQTWLGSPNSEQNGGAH